jgi:phosphate-selective porin OprO and OprP
MTRFSLLAFTALSLSAWPLAAQADAETEALRAHIKKLEARLDELERREQARTNQLGTLAPAAGPAKSSSLENRLAIVERKQELAEDDAKAKAEKNPTVEVGKKGLAITSADKQYSIKLTGYAQVDNRTFIDGGTKGDDELLGRRLRPILTVQASKDFSFRLMPDFAGSSTRVFDAHFDYRYSDPLQFRIGKFKPPVGLERLQSAADTFFAERGHPNNLAPSRDYGVMVYGELIPEIEYQVGVFNGNADLANSDGDDDNHKVGGSFGKRGGTTSATLLPEYRTPGQAVFFRYTTNTFATGDLTRIYPQAYYYYNNWGVLAEYAITAQDVQLTTNRASLRHQAWQVVGSYVLTGEDVDFKGSVKPARNFEPAKGGWGAFELVARVGETDIDNDTFPTFSSLTTSASRARSYGTGINWYLNENVKLVSNFELTTFDGGAAGSADRADEKVVISRAQFRF